MPIARKIFLDTFEIWCFQLKVESMKTPRYLINYFSFIALVINFDSDVLFIGLL